MWREIAPAFKTMFVFTILLGVIYPLATTGLAQLLFRDAANGSLISANSQVVGSSLIGQNFTKPEYFQPRPSAAGNGYDASNSSGSNLGPTNQKLIDRVKQSIDQFRKDNPDSPDRFLPIWSLPPGAVSTHTSVPLLLRRKRHESPKRAESRQSKSSSSSFRTPMPGSSAFSESPVSTC